jgi:hypothetical protein
VSITRREWLGQSLLSGAIAGSGIAAAAADSGARGAGASGAGRHVEVEALTFPDIAAEIEALIRVECNLAPVDSPVWFYWTAYCITPGLPPTAIADFEGLEMSRVVKRSDGSYFVKGIDLSFPRDHRSGKFISTAVNPATSETVEVPVSVLDGSFDPGYIVAPDRGWWPLKAPKPDKVDLRCRWWRENDLGRMRRERTAPPGFPTTFLEAGYYEFPMAAFKDPQITAVPYRTGGIYVFPFPKWLKMGDRPGHMLGMITGRKLGSVQELPREFLDRAEKEHPELLSLDTMFNSVPPP